MGYPQIEGYIQREWAEGGYVVLRLYGTGHGYDVRIEDCTDNVVKDQEGERYLHATSHDLTEALNKLEELLRQSSPCTS